MMRKAFERIEGGDDGVVDVLVVVVVVVVVDDDDDDCEEALKVWLSRWCCSVPL